jgi:hypothetical protein
MAMPPREPGSWPCWAKALPPNIPGTRRAALAREAIALADASPGPGLLARIGSSVL